MDRPIKVLLADDHPIVRAGIRAILAAEKSLELVGEATDGESAQHLCLTLEPDVLLLDLVMPGPRPVETIHYLREHLPQLKVLILTAYDEDAYIRGLLSVGVEGYILKDEAPETVVQAIKVVMVGGRWYSRQVLNRLAGGDTTQDVQPGLSWREKQMLEMIGRGWDNTHIAGELNLSEQTVRNYVHKLNLKFGFTTRGQAIIWARNHGLGKD